MKILITGTAGFIGFHLAERLVKEGHEVTGIDSINNYYDVRLKYGRLQQAGFDASAIQYNSEIKSAKGSHWFSQVNLEDKDAVDAIFNAKQFDVAVNLAAQAGVRYSIENPHAYINSNMVGFLNILESSKKHNLKHLVYASSSSVYGLNKDELFSTKHGVDHPISLYAATKRSNELMAHVYSNMFGLPVTGLRFFSVYGPWGRPDMALFLFTKAILQGQPIDVYNNGDMMRDFTYVDDIVEGVKRVIGHPPAPGNVEFEKNPDPSYSSAPFKVYNIGNSAPVKLLDFIDMIEQEVGKPAIKNYLPLQPGDVGKTCADVTPLINELHYKPSTPLQYGVKKFVEWYRYFYNV